METILTFSEARGYFSECQDTQFFSEEATDILIIG